MTPAIIVFTTAASRADANRIAQALVEQRLAACVQVDGPITSCYRWQGVVETAAEWRLSIKTREALYEQLEQAIRQLHTYEQPEIVALPITSGSAGYLNWIEQET
jgi:periplasmic divalent cation tolerance protein